MPPCQNPSTTAATVETTGADGSLTIVVQVCGSSKVSAVKIIEEGTGLIRLRIDVVPSYRRFVAISPGRKEG